MPHQELYNQIFAENKGSNPVELLQSITNEYPYFSIPHFYLLKETSATDFNYKKVAAKTALHFNNPFFLNYQITRKLSGQADDEMPEKVDVVEKIVAVDSSDEVSNADIVETGDKVDTVETVTDIEKVDMIENVDVVETVDVAKTMDKAENLELVAQVEKAETLEKVEGDISNEKAGKKEELLFEPLYTTDYFASQGIKLSEEAQANDKLGKQLRSFTDWLKTMKKVHQGKLPEGNASIDQAMQNLAEKSNKEQEIITEAMAEVFARQGKAEKAHDIYKKLSLLNPAKSAYFAAKIDLLKEN